MNDCSPNTKRFSWRRLIEFSIRGRFARIRKCELIRFCARGYMERQVDAAETRLEGDDCRPMVTYLRHFAERI